MLKLVKAGHDNAAADIVQLFEDNDRMRRELHRPSRSSADRVRGCSEPSLRKASTRSEHDDRADCLAQ